MCVVVVVMVSLQYFDYVMNVLIPECVIRLIADINGVSFDEVIHDYYNYECNIIHLSCRRRR